MAEVSPSLLRSKPPRRGPKQRFLCSNGGHPAARAFPNLSKSGRIPRGPVGSEGLALHDATLFPWSAQWSVAAMASGQTFRAAAATFGARAWQA
jgi:hypothetical protein